MHLLSKVEIHEIDLNHPTRDAETSNTCLYFLDNKLLFDRNNITRGCCCPVAIFWNQGNYKPQKMRMRSPLLDLNIRPPHHQIIHSIVSFASIKSGSYILLKYDLSSTWLSLDLCLFFWWLIVQQHYFGIQETFVSKVLHRHAKPENIFSRNLLHQPTNLKSWIVLLIQLSNENFGLIVW